MFSRKKYGTAVLLKGHICAHVTKIEVAFLQASHRAVWYRHSRLAFIERRDERSSIVGSKQDGFILKGNFFKNIIVKNDGSLTL